jgi:two-component system LytT family response regulator
MENHLKAVIIDDEEGARFMLASLLKDYCPEIEVVASCSNVPDGVLAINKYDPQLVFLDIEMPEYNGFELINFFKEIDFEIIFITAYSQYAVQAFEVSAIDYLLKPLDVEQLKKAVSKVKEKTSYSNIQERLDLMKSVYGGEQIQKIALPLGDGLAFVDVNDVVFFEAERSYTHVFLRDHNKFLISKPMRFFEDLLEHREQFFRLHRSYLINLNFVKKYTRKESMVVMDNQTAIPLARNKKQEFEQVLKKLKLLS